ncbi:hypothetical protein ANO14919_033950 [Xylariales sp. No.14919]|nr:hypothetical protein ANO14919_033950 [Xylariales sp. No.14919]
MIRGVSGGEKKRTSIAEAFIATTPIQAWDNTTRGLDSLTALKVVTTLKRSAVTRGTCVMVSLYQASPAIYDQCDKVSLLYEGRQITQVNMVKQGFESKAPCSLEDFVGVWLKSAEREALIEKIEGYNSEHPIGQDTMHRYHSG